MSVCVASSQSWQWALVLAEACNNVWLVPYDISSPPLWRCGPTRAMPSSFLRFLDHARRTTVGRTPLDTWSVRRRDLYVTTHNTHNRQTSMPPGGIRTHSLGRHASVDLRPRPHGQWDRPYDISNPLNSSAITTSTASSTSCMPEPSHYAQYVN